MADLSTAAAIVTIAAALALGVAGGLIGWLLGYKAGAADMREQAADSFTRYLRRTELGS